MGDEYAFDNQNSMILESFTNTTYFDFIFLETWIGVEELVVWVLNDDTLLFMVYN